MKVYITKYALTSGIDKADARETQSVGMVVYRMPGGIHDQYAHGECREWHKTWESAHARAEAMRLAKIASHKKSIANLEKLTFAKEEK